jgi:type IV pilus assembly protein PilW
MHGRRGFTLLEIMIALGVSAIALTAAVAAANAQQRAFYNSQKIRAAQNAGRSALLFLEQRLPRAGYGMDAPLALDFGWYNRDAVCPDLPCTPDRTDDADELVFYARDPAYWAPPEPEGEPRGHAWHLSTTAPAVTAADVTLQARPGDVFRKGQILQAVCPGEPRYAYFTVALYTPAPPAADPTAPPVAADLVVPLEPVNTNSPFHRQDVAMAEACFATNARVFLIDRYRLHVRPVAVDGRTDPFLVLDTGTDLDDDDDVDEADEILIAEGIEAFQVSYQFTNPDLLAGTDAAIDFSNTGAATSASDAITLTAFPGTVTAGQFDYEPSSFYRHRLTTIPAERLTNHQANVRAVQISLVARSPEPDPATSANLTWTAGSPLFLMNQTEIPDWVPVDGGYQRTVLETTVNLPNMTVRAMSYF